MSTITIPELPEDQILSGSELIAGWDSSGKMVKILLSRMASYFGFVKTINGKTPGSEGSVSLTTDDISDAQQANRCVTAEDKNKIALIKTDGVENRFLNEKGQYVTIANSGDPGNGETGADGKSAYQIAVDNGFSGSESEWLLSLQGDDGLPGAKGDKGDTGPAGLSAYQVWLSQGNSGTEADYLLSLKGEKGDPGTAASVVNMAGEVTGTTAASVVGNSAVIGKILTGLGSVAGDLLDTDSIVLGFSKVKSFMANLASSVRGTVMTGLDTNLAGTPSATDTLLQILGKMSRLITASNTLAKTVEYSVDFAGLNTVAVLVLNDKVTFSSVTTRRIQTVTYSVNGGTSLTTLADLNTFINSATGSYEVSITVTFTSGNNLGVVLLTGVKQ